MTPSEGRHNVIPPVPEHGAWKDVALQDAKTRLDEWRAAENRRDGLVRGSPEWQEADAEVQSAKKAFDAAFAQAYARYSEERYQAQNPHWSAEGERRTSPTE